MSDEHEFILYKAEALTGEVPDLTLSASETIPPLPGDGIGERLERLRARYREQGAHIASELFRSLPSGTLDALLVCLLERKSSLLAVPIGGAPKAAAETSAPAEPSSLAIVDAFIQSEEALAERFVDKSETHKLRANVAREIRQVLEEGLT